MCVCLCPFPVADTVANPRQWEKDRNEPCWVVGRMFCWIIAPLLTEQITSAVGLCPQLHTGLENKTDVNLSPTQHAPPVHQTSPTSSPCTHARTHPPPFNFSMLRKVMVVPCDIRDGCVCCVACISSEMNHHVPHWELVFIVSGSVPAIFKAELVVKGEVAAEMRNIHFLLWNKLSDERPHTVGTHFFLGCLSCIQTF